MPRALLLTALPDVQADDNAALLAPALRARGWRTRTACVDSLQLTASAVRVDGDGEALDLREQDLIWVLGFGRREGFLDKMQLLASVAETVPFVNDVGALLLLHGKYPQGRADPRFPQPPTLAAATPEPLVEGAREAGGRWVLKPPGGSFGRGVHVLDADAADFAATLRRLHEAGTWQLLQRFVPEVAAGEHRVLVAGGEVIGTYRRRPTEGPSNLASGGIAEPAAPDPARDALARAAAAWLLERGVRFAGLDLAGPWVLEANIVNPGGLATLKALDGIDRAPRVVAALLASIGA
ncbi:MAG TPA: hypothetical protein VLA56_12340 [Pseudomonadales bacterium]|nr:hypothetical protein [Pseudomonadales bacterium]